MAPGHRTVWRARHLVLSVSFLVVATVLGTGSTQANDIAGFTTVFGTDVVHAGFGGMRNDGSGTLTVSGVSGSVTKALLYWHGPTNSSDSSANAAVTFAGTAVSGTNIGFSSDNCWAFDNSQAYRADVTSLVPGNGSYSLAGFVKDANNINVNGASLIVFFDDGNAANNRDVVLFDGNDSNTSNAFDATGWNVSLSGINYLSGSAAITLHVSDGQDYNEAAVLVNSTTIAAEGGIFQGDSVPFGTYDNHGHLWDIKTYDVTSLLSPGANTLNLTSGDTGGDCLSLIVAAIDLPAGAAPVTNPSPTPTPDGTPEATPTPPVVPTPPTASAPTPTPTPAPSPTPTPAPTPTPTPDPSPTPVGVVAGITGTPPGAVLPATDTSVNPATPAHDNWELILLAVAGLLAATYLMTSDGSEVRRRKR